MERTLWGSMRTFGRPLWVLLSGVLFTHLGYYLVIPILAIILSTEKGLSVGQAGLVLGTGSFALLTGSLVGGWLADRLGQRRTLVVGLLLRGLGLLGYGFVTAIPLLFATSAVQGLGGGIYTPPAKAGIATYASEKNKSTAFSFRGVAANIGVTIGPLVASLLLAGSSRVLFIMAAIVHAGLAIAHQFLLPASCENQECPPANKGFAFEILKDRPFMVFSFVTIFIWALYAQLTFSIPLRANDILPNPKNVAMLWSITSILIIFLQAPLTRYLSVRIHPLLSLAAGLTLMGIGLGSVMWSSQFAHLLLSVVIFTFGEMLISPIIDTVVSELAKPELIGSYFGIATFVWGMGEALGNISGGQLMNLAKNWNVPSLPWVIFAIVGAVLGAVLFLLQKWPALASPLSGSLLERTDQTVSFTVPWRMKGKKR